MRTLVRVVQYGLVALLLHFSVTILGQQSRKTDFFKADVSDNFDDIYEKYISVTADNCHIRVSRRQERGLRGDNLPNFSMSANYSSPRTQSPTNQISKISTSTRSFPTGPTCSTSTTWLSPGPSSSPSSSSRDSTDPMLTRRTTPV